VTVLLTVTRPNCSHLSCGCSSRRKIHPSPSPISKTSPSITVHALNHEAPVGLVGGSPQNSPPDCQCQPVRRQVSQAGQGPQVLTSRDRKWRPSGALRQVLRGVSRRWQRFPVFRRRGWSLEQVGQLQSGGRANASRFAPGEAPQEGPPIMPCADRERGRAVFVPGQRTRKSPRLRVILPSVARREITSRVSTAQKGLICLFTLL
jgi:hypothetical protein